MARFYVLRFTFYTFFCLFMMGCAGTKQGKGSFGPVPTVARLERVISAEPMIIDFVTLNAAPHTYQDKLIRVSGNYTPLPLSECAPYRGLKVRWALVADSLRMDATGFESVLRLVAPDTLLTIDGIWRQYKGPLGCGKELPVQISWYLEAQRIVEPNPIANLALIPDGATPDPGFLGPPETLPTQLPTEGANPLETPITSVTPTPTLPNVATLPPGTGVPTLAVSPTPTPRVTLSPTPSRTPAGTLFPTHTPTITPTPSQTPTPTITPTLFIIPTATSGPPLPTFTPGGYPAPSPYP